MANYAREIPMVSDGRRHGCWLCLHVMFYFLCSPSTNVTARVLCGNAANLAASVSAVLGTTAASAAVVQTAGGWAAPAEATWPPAPDFVVVAAAEGDAGTYYLDVTYAGGTVVQHQAVAVAAGLFWFIEYHPWQLRLS